MSEPAALVMPVRLAVTWHWRKPERIGIAKGVAEEHRAARRGTLDIQL
jgi:hypothetical protein